MASLAFANL